MLTDPKYSEINISVTNVQKGIDINLQGFTKVGGKILLVKAKMRYYDVLKYIFK